MKITNTWKERVSGLQATAEYEDLDDFSKLPYEKCKNIACFAFYKGKLLIVHREETGTWNLVSGGIDYPETFDECVKRELKEESNTRPLSIRPLGYQKAYLPDKPIQYQLRFYCEVEPIGKFIEDPDGDITAIKYINPKDYKKYFDWGKVGERLMERALELKKNL